jgi:predicted dithiol-disulfide oxidoreductase (DUF899 family)
VDIDKQIADLQKTIVATKEALTALLKQKAPKVVSDYQLTRSTGEPVLLSELFQGKDDLIVIHNMGKSCVYCTLWADGINGVVDHLQDRAGLVLVSPDAPDVQHTFASSRGWRFPIASASGSEFITDMGYMSEKSALPGTSTFKKKSNGTIQLIGQDMFGPGDDYCLVWPLLDLLADGSNDWKPKYTYRKSLVELAVS